jgi:hypothetical protein
MDMRLISGMAGEAKSGPNESKWLRDFRSRQVSLAKRRMPKVQLFPLALADEPEQVITKEMAA